MPDPTPIAPEATPPPEPAEAGELDGVCGLS
jgi:hypothetical protein